ncbi:VOC family protein [Microbulbifer sp. VTAC004]|uniref:VOC family protein n=1 Tax=Microbulbifer sp. VTAC004 TaxID=3243386 RepID=UPI004039669A
MEPIIYLTFNGNCLEAMTHYAETLGGKIWGTLLNADAPNPESRMPGGDDMVMNMAMTLGSATLMASDNSREMYEKPQGFRIFIPPKSLREFDRIYNVFSKEAKAIDMAPVETFWAERFALLTDKYGTPWMLNYEGSKAETVGEGASKSNPEKTVF